MTEQLFVTHLCIFIEWAALLICWWGYSWYITINIKLNKIAKMENDIKEIKQAYMKMCFLIVPQIISWFPLFPIYMPFFGVSLFMCIGTHPAYELPTSYKLTACLIALFTTVMGVVILLTR
jgi:hypothetical protein